MKTSTIVWVIAVLIILGGGWYWWSTSNQEAMPSGAAGINGSPNQGNLGGTDTGTPQTPEAMEGMTLRVANDAKLGQYLIAENGMTLYTYTADTDTPGKSSCSGTCATNWPPYTSGGADSLHVAVGLTGALGVIMRADGSQQVTYNGQPLYFYIGDTATGETTGQGKNGAWYVAKP